MHITNHSITYHDEFGTAQNVSAGVVLTKDQEKAIGAENIAGLLKSKAIRDSDAEKPKKEAKAKAPATTITKGDGKPPAGKAD